MNPAECVSECVDGLHDTHQFQGRIIETDIQPVWVYGDAGRLAQIVSNLLGNAVKYTDPGAHIRVDVKTEAEAAIIRVKDTGIGIAAELLPHIFDLFACGDLGVGRAAEALLADLPLALGSTLAHRRISGVAAQFRFSTALEIVKYSLAYTRSVKI